MIERRIKYKYIKTKLKYNLQYYRIPIGQNGRRRRRACEIQTYVHMYQKKYTYNT